MVKPEESDPVSICLLARHGSHDVLDRVLVGRMTGVGLNAKGREEAVSVAERAQRLGVTQIQSSPQRRAIETAACVSERLGLSVEVCPALDEVDFGVWTGRTFDELSCDHRWRRWNESRCVARAPAGESMREVQVRVLAHLAKASAIPQRRILMVTHAEVIRAAALSMMTLSLDAWQRIDVPPGSITRIEMRGDRHALVGMASGASP